MSYLVSTCKYRPLAYGSPDAQDGDGISSDWLIAELTHRQAHGLKLQYRAYLDEIAIVNSGFGGARLGRGDGGAISRERVRKLVAGRRSVRCGPLGQPWAGPGA